MAQQHSIGHFILGHPVYVHFIYCHKTKLNLACQKPPSSNTGTIATVIRTITTATTSSLLRHNNSLFRSIQNNQNIKGSDHDQKLTIGSQITDSYFQNNQDVYQCRQLGNTSFSNFHDFHRQVVYQRWQWGDSYTLCHLHSPIQVAINI